VKETIRMLALYVKLKNLELWEEKVVGGLDGNTV